MGLGVQLLRDLPLGGYVYLGIRGEHLHMLP